MYNEIKVEIEYGLGYLNKVTGTFYINSDHTFKRDLSDVRSFLTLALSNSRHNDIMVTVTQRTDSIIKMETSRRYIMEDWKNAYQDRPWHPIENQYPETPSKTFGTEGNGRKEFKQAVTKYINQIYKNSTERE